MTTVVTGFSPQGFELYGRRAVEAFLLHWPRSVNLVAYVEESTGISNRRYEERPLASVEPCAAFLERHAENAEAHGRGPPNARWDWKDRDQGYSFRFDAHKFCRMAMIPQHAARLIMKTRHDFFEQHGKSAPDDILVWMDGDVIAYRAVPENLVERLLGDAHVAYLGRAPAHSETGFVAFRLPLAITIIELWANTYATDQVFDLPEWHSAFVFDWARKAEQQRFGLRCRDLTPGGRGHVWFQSELGQYMDHLKGPKRKERGRSHAREMVVGHRHSYWGQTRGSFFRKVDERVRQRNMLKSLVKKTYYAIAPVCPPLRALKKRYDDFRRQKKSHGR